MYKVILYNCGKKVKVFNKYKTYSNALKLYNSLIKNNVVFFPKTILWDGRETDYELVLTAPPQNKALEYIKDDMGGNVKVKTSGKFVIKKITKYPIEDEFVSRITRKKYTFKVLIKDLLKNDKLTHVLTVLQNKLVIEFFENEKMDVLVLKNKDSAYRLCETIHEFNKANENYNFIYFSDPTYDTRLRLYDALSERYGISREYMQKVTTH